MAGTLIVDSSGAPMQHATSPVRMQARDGLGAAFASIGGLGGYQQSPMARMFGLDLAFAAYLGSGLLQKTIDIPASDRTREWRDWQADDKVIQKIEAEEKRLAIRAKFKAAEVLRGLGGGALILALPGDPASPAPLTGKLQAVNVVSRRQLSLVDVNDDLTSPLYGEPKFFRMETAGGGKNIHPSRVIPFRGEPYPAMAATVSADDRYWGQCRLLRVVNEVAKSDDASRWFSQLIRKAKLLRFGISGLTDYDQGDLDKRVALIAQSENMLNATIYNLPTKDGAGAESGGEKIEDYQVAWTGIPAVQDMLDQRVAAVADIPFTRLMGRSPAGMNATGQHDMDNYLASIGAGQELEVRPCLERLDAVMLPSAGVALADNQTWRWSPLSKPNPKDEAERFDKTVTALGKIRDMAAIPDEAFNAGVQGVIEQNGWMPGAMQKLGEMPEDERFGIKPSEPERDADGKPVDPSAIQTKGGDPDLAGTGAAMEAEPRRRAANDAKPIPLYVQRKLLNADELIRWAKAQGFKSTLDASDMHVTVLCSRTPVDPIKMGTTWADNEKGEISIKPGGPRAVEKLGDTAVVLLFASDDLSWRHRSMVEAGASHDYAEYQPHVTLTYDAGDVDLDAIKPFTGALRFGPELFEPLDLDWKSKVTEE
jgi:phage-related protein (TIGR01555 family)